MNGYHRFGWVDILRFLHTGQLKEDEGYDVDFDHQFIETEKFDAKPTYKKFLGYRPGVAVIGDMIVGIENSDGNTNVRFHQKDTLRRFFERIEQKGLTVNRSEEHTSELQSLPAPDLVDRKSVVRERV